MPEVLLAHGQWHWLVERQGEVLERVLLTHHTKEFQELHPRQQGYRGVTVILGDADHARVIGFVNWRASYPGSQESVELAIDCDRLTKAHWVFENVRARSEHPRPRKGLRPRHEDLVARSVVSLICLSGRR